MKLTTHLLHLVSKLRVVKPYTSFLVSLHVVLDLLCPEIHLPLTYSIVAELAKEFHALTRPKWLYCVSNCLPLGPVVSQVEFRPQFLLPYDDF
jgi:hypothetical protein